MKKAAEEDVREAAFEKDESKGREEGREEGRQEERREIALAMLQDNLPLKQVSRLTGLSTKEIESLKKQSFLVITQQL